MIPLRPFAAALAFCSSLFAAEIKFQPAIVYDFGGKF